MSSDRKPSIQIAIDGPVAAGKGVVAQKLAKKLGILNVDTGAMYRVATLLALINGIDVRDERSIVAMLKHAVIELRKPEKDEKDGRWNTVLLNGMDVSEAIRKREVAVNVAKVAALPAVREVLVEKQQHIANQESVVMEGRDIGSVVLPNATIKIYLTADENVRARRRWKDRLKAGEEVEFDMILREVQERDRLDKTRKASPLERQKDAVVVDSTNMSVAEVVDEIIGYL